MVRQIGLLVALGCCGLSVTPLQSVSHRLASYPKRASASDLEVSGEVPGLPRGEPRLVTREFLLSLPQVSVPIYRDQDLPAIIKPGVHVGGVYLDVLAERLGFPVDTPSAIEAVCADGYAASFPSGYTRIHRPVFVLTIDGLSPHEWSIKNRAYDLGPYFIAYEHFEPYFKVLSHEDRPLEPDEVNKLFFTTKAVLYAGIEPKANRDPAQADSPVVSGFRIARQNCFRCHNSGEFGGTQSGVSWKKLERLAHSRPAYFAAWIYDPKLLDPKARMPANRNYDKATRVALTKYFAEMAVEGQ